MSEQYSHYCIGQFELIWCPAFANWEPSFVSSLKSPNPAASTGSRAHLIFQQVDASHNDGKEKQVSFILFFTVLAC